MSLFERGVLKIFVVHDDGFDWPDTVNVDGMDLKVFFIRLNELGGLGAFYGGRGGFVLGKENRQGRVVHHELSRASSILCQKLIERLLGHAIETCDGRRPFAARAEMPPEDPLFHHVRVFRVLLKLH